ncbi:MAG: hypothetical protein M3387_11670 [Actinomycetota bacterium]|nr:hypothetical protein [Actinomycetota bacterium]
MRRLLLAGIVVLLAGCADDGAAIRTLTDGRWERVGWRFRRSLGIYPSRLRTGR